MKNTEITYLYRDASNWKQYETLILSGEITPEEIGFIVNKLQDGYLFIPKQVGLIALQKCWADLNEDDHIYHELYREDIRIVNEAPTIDISTQQLVDNFKQVKSWNVIQAEHDLWDDKEIR